jgi:hypothetical protein
MTSARGGGLSRMRLNIQNSVRMKVRFERQPLLSKTADFGPGKAGFVGHFAGHFRFWK